ncbi:MAG: nucleoside deaminase [Actinomycetota bacterium]
MINLVAIDQAFVPGADDQAAIDEAMMGLAIDQAVQGLSAGGIPIGAVLAVGTEVLGAGHNQRVQRGSAIRHGETDALENAGRLSAATYAQTTMYTTLSPCHMCTGAILLYGIPRVVIGENETYLGAEDLLRSHGVEVINLDSPRCIELMTSFIADRPELWFEDIGEVLEPVGGPGDGADPDDDPSCASTI